MYGILVAGRMSASGNVMSRSPHPGRIAIFKSELDYISRCILDRKHIETGGQLFGYWTEGGVPVVLYAIGPGPKANHQQAFFNQDVDYLVAVGRALKARFGLHHIGEWHSHHQLGLARPSGHDAHTMVSTIREKGLGRFLLCIGNCTETASTLNGFLCDESACRAMAWDVIFADSPVRGVADSSLGDILVHPETKSASHGDPRLADAPRPRSPYTTGYWLNDRANNRVFKSIVDHVSSKNAGVETKVQVNGRGEAVIRNESGSYCETVLFPEGFPKKAPVVSRYLNGNLLARSDDGGWKGGKSSDILKAFIEFYRTA